MLDIETVKDYKNYDYIKSLAMPSQACFPPIEEFGVIEWSEEESYIWCPTILCNDKHYVFCSIEDDTYGLNLDTIDQIKLRERVYHEYSMYSLPYQYQNSHFGDGKNIVTSRDGKKASRSRLSHVELLDFLKNGTEKQQNYYHNKIANQKLTWHLTGKSREYPVRIYLCGMDDTSYTAVYPTMEAAKNDLKEIEKVSKLSETFYFTN